jgi:cytidylate kinase
MRIAVRGPIFSGKTTLGKELAANHGFHVIQFSDSLKEMAALALTVLATPTKAAAHHQWPRATQRRSAPTGTRHPHLSQPPVGHPLARSAPHGAR